MKFTFSSHGIFFMGKPGDLMKLLEKYACSHISLKDFINLSLH